MACVAAVGATCGRAVRVIRRKVAAPVALAVVVPRVATPYPWATPRVPMLRMRWLGAESVVGHATFATVAASAPRSKPPLRKGDDVTVAVTGLAFGKGGAVGRIVDAGNPAVDGVVAFVAGDVAPGATVSARILKVKRSFVDAEATTIVDPGPHAVHPRCPHFADCGGCKYQHVAYGAQADEKQRFVERQLRGAGGGHDNVTEVRPIVRADTGGGGLDATYGYRNRMDFTFANRSWEPQAAVDAAIAARSAVDADPGNDREALWQDADDVCVGLHPARSGHWHGKVLAIDECHLQSPIANAALAVVRRAVLGLGLRAYGGRSRDGLLKSLSLRTGDGDQLMVSIVVTREELEPLQPIVDALVAALPLTPVDGNGGGGDGGSSAVRGHLESVVATVEPPLLARAEKRRIRAAHYDTEAGRAAAEHEIGAREATTVHVLHGRGTLTARMGGVSLRVSPQSFLQANVAQANRLYAAVRDACDLGGAEVVCDLFCGTGSIGLSLAGTARQVVGVEVVAKAVADARYNARLNGANNADFIAWDLGRLRGRVRSRAGSREGFNSVGDYLDPIAADTRGRRSGTGDGAGTDTSRTPLADRAPPDVVVVNPPRGGLHKDLVNFLRGWGAHRLVYVSCNPSTQARDIALLCAPPSDSDSGRGVDGDDGDVTTVSASAGNDDADEVRRNSGATIVRSPLSVQRYRRALGPWTLEYCQPVDMFPHAAHVENVAVLSREVRQ